MNIKYCTSNDLWGLLDGDSQYWQFNIIME